MAREIPDHVFSDPPPEICEICDRAVATTVHHLTPKDRTNSETAAICNPCHRHIHAVFTNHELKHEYNTVEAIRAADRMHGFIAWIRKTDPDRISVAQSHDVRRWRRRQ